MITFYRLTSALTRRWAVDLVDPRSGARLSTLLPLDREKNSDRRRRALPAHDQNVPDTDGSSPSVGIAPLLKQQMADYAPPACHPPTCPKTTPPTQRITRTPNHESQISAALWPQIQPFPP